ncbi:MAG: DUF3857 domain-containing protein [Flavobacteriales bacterium]|nr:MAG: DUF3857 domain-containing protein [Flavobacteriales bacterium]
MKLSQKLTLLFFLFFQFSTALAQKKNFSIVTKEPNWIEKISIKDDKPSLKNVQDGYYLLLYEQQNNIETKEQYEHVIRDIVSDNGVQNGSQISVTYDPSYQKLFFHKVTVWRNNKAINKLNVNGFKIIQNETELSKFIYSGTYDAHLILDDIRKGDKIEYAFTIQGHNPVFLNKYSTTLYFQWGSEIANLYYNIITKKERQFQIKNFNTVPSLKTKEKNGLKIYEWQDALTKTITSEDYEPSWYNPYARTHFSETKNWKEVVDWALTLNQYDLSKSATFNNKVKELKQLAKGSKEQYLNLATRFVQDQIRYMGIEIGEYSHRPNSPEKILKQRYGDCKDKSLLLISLLKANGINAYSVYINTYSLENIKNVLPAPNVFNHEVSVVEFNGKKIWIDATITDQGGSILENYFPYTANVLVIKPGNDRLEYVKSNPTGKITSTSVFKLAKAVDGGKTSLIIKSNYKANNAEILRGEINSSGINTLSKDYLEYYTKQYPSISASKEIEINDDRNNNQISVIEHYEIENIWENTDSTSNKLGAYFYSDMVSSELRSLKKGRGIPFSLKYPSNVQQIIKVITPGGWPSENEQITINRNGYSYSSSVKHDTDTLLLEYSYQNKKPILSADETEQYVKDKAKIVKDINYALTWDKDATENVGGTNVWAVLAFCVTAIIGICGAIFLYIQKSEFDIEEIKNAPQIGGWLTVVAIGILLTPIFQLVSVFNTGHFDNVIWKNSNLKDATANFYLKALLFGEIIVNTLLVVYSVLIVFLFFNRRKSLPNHYIIFRILIVVVPILDTIFAYSIYEYAKLDLDQLGLSVSAEVLSVLRSLIPSVIWITYFLRSTRVKSTFVFSYPRHIWRAEHLNDVTSTINLSVTETQLKEEEQYIYKIPTEKKDEDI